jgi:hypothetical protein
MDFANAHMCIRIDRFIGKESLKLYASLHPWTSEVTVYCVAILATIAFALHCHSPTESATLRIDTMYEVSLFQANLTRYIAHA